MPIQETLYTWTIRGLRVVSPLLARGESKLARGIRARRGAVEEMEAWGRERRDRSRPVVWFHAPSVGEGFQARAVAEALLTDHPAVQVVYTWFSPSAESFAPGMPAAFRGFLPWDLPGDVERVLDAVRPDLLVFTKTEVWPVLSREAADRHIPSALVAGTLAPGAGRSSAPGRWLLGPAFRRLSGVAVVSADDADRFRLLGVPPDRMVVTGDPGIDSAAARLQAADPDAPYLRPFRGREGATLVAGSTWPPDEEVLVPAVTEARRARPRLTLVVAPHEPTPDHVEALTRALEARGWRVELLGRVEERGTIDGVDAVVVDRVGVLAQLYTVASVAYVGGGFHDQGLHSVLEPAAAGVPVIFGPRHANARAAAELLEVGGAVEIREAKDLADALGRWTAAPGADSRAGSRAASVAGDRARRYIEGHRGASVRTIELLAHLLESGDAGPGGEGDERKRRDRP